MKYIDDFLNKITMYKLVLYGLLILAGISMIFGFFGWLSFSGTSLIFSLVTLGVVCFITNEIFSKIFKVHTNSESYLITALILFFITFPIESFYDFKLLVLVGFLAMASKYILAIKKKHVFNPAGISLVIMAIIGLGVGVWWVGSGVMMIPTAILGFLVLRKLQRFTMFGTFIIFGVLSIVLTLYLNGFFTVDVLKQIATSWPLIFLGSIMLTEPLTTPHRNKFQIIYAVIVGSFFGMQFHIGNLYSTPELALVIGNIFSYLVSPKARLVLTLKQKNKITGDVYDFVFKSNSKLNFEPGQYLEWTLDSKGADIRGNRRYFTIASSPTEEDIILGTKFYPNPSTFKQKLSKFSEGDMIIASELRGEFTLPENKNKKLVFIAGGIGVTPFRSMAKYMIDKGESRDIKFLYSCKTMNDMAYKEIFEKAGAVGWDSIFVANEHEGQLDENCRKGFITKEMLINEIPDYKERMFYISGTHGMVSMFEKTLKELGVHKKHIKVDFFPGFV